MTKDEWLGVCATALLAEGIENFHPLEIADVGREARSLTSRAQTKLEAPAPELIPNAVMLCGLLCELREAHPAGPVLINSWYRDRLYNYMIGGATLSMHLTCGAADVTKIGWAPQEVAEWFEAHEDANSLGVGRYQTFTHIDIRGKLHRPAPARWER